MDSAMQQGTEYTRSRVWVCLHMTRLCNMDLDSKEMCNRKGNLETLKTSRLGFKIGVPDYLNVGWYQWLLYLYSAFVLYNSRQWTSRQHFGDSKSFCSLNNVSIIHVIQFHTCYELNSRTTKHLALCRICLFQRDRAFS